MLGTNCDQTYDRYLRVGEEVAVTTRLESVVGPKQTGVGEGYFVTTRNIWRVGRRAGSPRCCSGCSSSGPKERRQPDPVDRRSLTSARRSTATPRSSGRAPRPASCGSRSATPAARCATRPARSARRATRWTAGTSSRPAAARSSPSSCTTHPPVPGRELPILLALVELEEGVRMVGELVDATPEEVEIGDAGAWSASSGSTTT